jgi:hypothetical protein
MLSDSARFSCPQLLRYPNGEPGEIKWAKYIPTPLFFSAPLGDLAYKQIFPALLGWPKASNWISVSSPFQQAVSSQSRNFLLPIANIHLGQLCFARRERK